jgi:hypothetical protein
MSHLGFFQEAAMKDKTGGSGSLRRAGAAAAVAAAAVLAAGCGVHVSFGNGGNGSASTGSATFRANLAYAHCMQTHGVPGFPDPNPSQGFAISGQLNGNASGSSPLIRANNACKQLLPGGSATTGSGNVTQAQLDQALKVVHCLRAHGEPTFPDPTVVGGSLHFTLQTGVLHSSTFQTAVKDCKSLIPKGVNFP